jgi:beta-lactamase regulating signal transducer with metallopeptidase domain
MTEWLAGTGEFALAVTLKASLLVALGFLAAALLRDRSAAQRHLVWSVALAAAAAMPLLQLALPSIEVAVLPAPVSAPASMVVASPVAPVAVEVRSAPVSTAAPAAAPSLPSPAVLLAGLWLLGVLALSVRLAAGVLRVWWIERRSSEVTDDAWVRLTDTLSRRLKLGRIVTLLRAEPAAVPMTWGVFRPVVVLPGESAEWDEERRTVVLAHELAHVRRWDALTQWVAHVAVVVHWYNPLVWMAARRLHDERERACDDAVLAIGARPSAYADHLLTLVQSLGRSEGPVAALAMARRSQFEGRLLAILDRAIPRRGVSRTALTSAVVLALAAAAPLSALRATQRTASAEKESARAPSASPSVASTAGPGAGLAQTSARTVKAVPGAASTAARPPAAIAAVRDTGDVSEMLAAVGLIGSSEERTRVLIDLLTYRRLSPGESVTFLERAGEMESANSVHRVLVAALDHLPIGERRVRDAFFRALEGMSSNAEKRDVLIAALQRNGEDVALASAVFRATHTMSSDANRREVLVAGVQARRVDARTRGDFVAALTAIQSDYERSMVVTALGGMPGATTTAAAAGAVWNSTTTNRHIEDEVERSRTVLAARKVRLNPARDEIAAIDPGGSFTLHETRADGGSRSLKVTPSASGALQYEYRVDGDARPVDAAARIWMRELIRASAN